jgi:cytochrome b
MISIAGLYGEHDEDDRIPWQALRGCSIYVDGIWGAGDWLSITDRFWGVAWVQNAPAFLAQALVALAGLHVGGVVYTSLRHRENLPLAMVTGRKRPPRRGDVA